MKLANLSKILKCAGNDDAITMKSEDNGDTITFMFESPSEPPLPPPPASRVLGPASRHRLLPAACCRRLLLLLLSQDVAR